MAGFYWTTHYAFTKATQKWRNRIKIWWEKIDAIREQQNNRVRGSWSGWRLSVRCLVDSLFRSTTSFAVIGVLFLIIVVAWFVDFLCFELNFLFEWICLDLKNSYVGLWIDVLDVRLILSWIVLMCLMNDFAPSFYTFRFLHYNRWECLRNLFLHEGSWIIQLLWVLEFKLICCGLWLVIQFWYYCDKSC